MGPVGVNSVSYGLVSGRISSVALDPSDATGNHVFVGTTGGGLWASQNAAASTAGSVVFVPVTDGLGALSGVLDAGVSVGAVTVQPGGTGVVLAGLGDPNDALDSYYGAGLLRSTDGGTTWTLIAHTMDLEDGLGQQDYSFVGEGFAGFAWSTTNVQLVVAAVSQAYEGTLVNADATASSYEGLYWSNDGGATWHLGRITDLNGQDVQGPEDPFDYPDGNAATSVVWNPVRQVFVAAVRYHGYYQSTDGMNWTQMASQPGPGFTAGNCPTEASSIGVAGCPIFRGSLAVNPISGDTFAWSVDAFNVDQGIWRDKCAISGNACTNSAIAFGTQLSTAALETVGGDGTISNGDYNLTLAAVPSGQDTLLFAGDNDLWRCSLANSCAWRNTTNSTSCISGMVGEYEHALAWDAGNPLLVFLGTDSGLWRSVDDVGETGSVCAATDASHFQDLNGGLGPLAEVESLGQSNTNTGTMLAGLGANGFAGVMNAPATAGNWNEVLGGEGGPVAVNPATTANNWYANNAAGVSILDCAATAGTLCTPAEFGTSPVIGETQVEEDGLSMTYPAEFKFDAVDGTQLLIGTCRVWRGPASGAGWTAANAISPILDGTGGSVCDGNALIRSIAVEQVTGGGEVIYVGMAGAEDGGGVVPGHVFTATLTAGGTAGTWTDLALSPVTNNALPFNAFGMDVSSLYVDSHDATGGTAYATISGFSDTAEPVQQLYRTTDGGGQWTAITGNLPNAPANAVVVDPQDVNTVYVATDVGVYMTRAIGTCGTAACWAAYGTGLPLAPVTQLIAAPVAATGAGLTAGTYGRGVWQIPLVTAGAALATMSSSPSSLTFAGLTVGSSSAAQTVTLKNTGTPTLTVSGLGFGGGAAGNFSETDTCVGVALAKNATCSVKVTFTPTLTGSLAGNLVVSANVAGGQLLMPISGTGLATANVTLEPASLGFGSVEVGTKSVAQTVNVANGGGSAVSIISQVVTAPFVRLSSTCGSSLAAGAACVVTVGFNPTQAGAATGSFTLTDSVGTQTAVLSGTAVAAPTDTLSATSLSFPSTVVGQVSAPLTVTITNNGGLPLTGIGTSVSGTSQSAFTAVSGCGGELAARASCAISVTFAPSAAGEDTATLTISDALRAQTVSLAGPALRPALLALSGTALLFGDEQMNMASAARTLTITNKGGSPMATPSFAITEAGTAGIATSFGVSATTCVTSLAAGATCTVSVVFTPVAAGAVTATFTVSTSTVGVASIAATLTGTGLTPPALSVSPAALQMGSVVVGNSTGLFTVEVTNTGQETMNVPTFAVSGANAADFALSAPTDVTACTVALTPGLTCSIQVTFSPTLIGVESAMLTVTGSNALPGVATVSLSGTGTPLILLEASPAQVSFPATMVGSASVGQTVTLSNLGRQTADLLQVNLTGPYSVVTALTTCGTTLATASSCTVGVNFDPTASGDQPGVLTATVSNQGVAALTVPLDGTGVAVGGILLSPTQMTFGSTLVNSTSTEQTLTVTNSGQAALAGVSIGITGQATGNYSLTGNTCASLAAGTLAVGASCTTGVVFTPTSLGIETGTVTVSSTSLGVTPGVVSLVGDGIPAGALTASPMVASFGAVTVGETGPAQTVTLTNAGATALEGLQLVMAGDYSLTTNGCGTQSGGALASGATCSFAVNFLPSQVGTRIGSVTVESTNAGFTPLLVGLTGTGLAAAQLAVTPARLAFGAVPVDSNSVVQDLTVTNAGTGTLVGLLFATTAPFNVGSGTCGPQLAAGASCTVPVIFAPTVSGSQSGTVTVSSTSLGVAPVVVAVTGTGGLPAALNLSPTAVSFPGTTVGKTSAGQTVTVSNTGGLALTGLTIVISGDFAVSSSSCASLPGGTLAAGGSCSVVVSFTPSVAGGRTGSLTASSSTSGAANAIASLSGIGLTPAALGIAPAQLTFAETLVGTVSATQMVTVTNSGQSGISDLQLAVTTGFELNGAQTTCTAVLVSGASCTAGMEFAPSAAGAMTGQITASSLFSGTAGSPVLATAALSGIGAPPLGIATMPAALVQFGTTGVGQAAQPVTVTVTNTGALTALTGLALSVNAAGTANGFGLSANTCGTAASPGTLPGGASCTVNVTLTPAAAGGLTGALQIATTNPGVQAALNLAGTGLDFQFTVVGSNAATVVQGQTAYYTLAITPLGGTSGSFSFACGQLPTNVQCGFNPTQLAGLRATGNTQLGLVTAEPVLTSDSRKWPGVRGVRVLAVCGVLALPLGWWKRRDARMSRNRSCRNRSRVVLLLVVLSIGIVSGLSSCAGAGGGGSTGGPSNGGAGTPPGSYTVPVMASSAGVTHSLQVTLVVN